MRAKITYKSPKSRIPRGKASSPLINARCFQQIGRLKSENLPSSKMFSCYKLQRYSDGFKNGGLKSSWQGHNLN